MKLLEYFFLSMTCLLIHPAVAEVIIDGSFRGYSTILSGPDYAVTQSMGQVQGNNLFHSFSQFSIHSGETAHFQAADNINNIFARVTGGNVSTIDGGITSNSLANLWLINPAGWIVGQHAAINIPGSFHLSTATGLNFKDGGQFLAEAKSRSTLSIAEPIDYQFQNPQQTTISIDKASITMKAGKDLSMIGGDIDIQEAHLAAPGGHIELNSNFGIQGKWQMNEQGLTQVNGQQGVIRMSQSTVDTTISGTQSGGNITVNAKDLLLTGLGNSGTHLMSDTTFGSSGNGGSIAIFLSGLLQLSHQSSISSITRGSGNGGKITVNSQQIDLDDKSSLSIASFYGKGNAGTININTGTLNLIQDSFLESSTAFKSQGRAGNISITSPHITINDGSIVLIADENSTGAPGNLTISGKDNATHDGSLILQQSKISTTNNRTTEGNGGDIKIDTNTLVMHNGFIQANSAAQDGSGGRVIVYADKTLRTQEQLQIGGNQRISFDQKLNVIQAAAPHGENGEVNVSSIELNIAGQLAKVDTSLAHTPTIANDPCGVARGQMTSSLIQTGNGGLPSHARDPFSLSLKRHLNLPPQTITPKTIENIEIFPNSMDPVCEHQKQP